MVVMQIKLIERHKRYLKNKLILRRVAALLFLLLSFTATVNFQIFATK
jgi:hypothetical protein